jgi:hypothetical protein
VGFAVTSMSHAWCARHDPAIASTTPRQLEL